MTEKRTDKKRRRSRETSTGSSRASGTRKPPAQKEHSALNWGPASAVSACLLPLCPLCEETFSKKRGATSSEAENLAQVAKNPGGKGSGQFQLQPRRGPCPASHREQKKKPGCRVTTLIMVCTEPQGTPRPRGWLEASGVTQPFPAPGPEHSMQVSPAPGGKATRGPAAASRRVTHEWEHRPDTSRVPVGLRCPCDDNSIRSRPPFANRRALG